MIHYTHTHTHTHRLYTIFAVAADCSRHGEPWVSAGRTFTRVRLLLRTLCSVCYYSTHELSDRVGDVGGRRVRLQQGGVAANLLRDISAVLQRKRSCKYNIVQYRKCTAEAQYLYSACAHKVPTLGHSDCMSPQILHWSGQTGVCRIESMMPRCGLEEKSASNT